MKRFIPDKRTLFIALGVVCLLVIAMPVVGWAQPGLPSGPEQSPLGGLELLAVAGGSYALMKLRGKKNE